MSDADSSNGREDASPGDGGILGALPRTRPQRASARRAAARSGAGKSETQAPAPGSRDGAAKGGGRANAKNKDASKNTSAEGARAREPRSATRRTPSTAKTSRPAATRARTRRAPSARVEPPAPRQGYEPEDELGLGATVNPPSGVELVESVADLVGELTMAGFSAGGRLVKDVLSLLRRP